MANTLENRRPENYLTRLAASDLGRSYKSLVVEELDIEAGSTVLDLGCGPGADLAALADAVGSTGRVLAVDKDESAVAQASQAVFGLPQVAVREGDVHQLDLPDQCVDRVHTDRVLQHVMDPNAVVAEAARLLSPRGIAGFAEPDWDTLVVDYPDPAIPVAYRRFVTDRVVRNSRIGRQLPSLCEDNGLVPVRVIPITAVFQEVTQADRILGFQRVTKRAVDAAYLTVEQGAAWLDHLRTARLFASVTLFVTFAERESNTPA